MSSCSHLHPPEKGLKGYALAAMLAGAEARCEATGERLTSSRRRVLDLLLQAGTPMKAYDLMAAFGPEGEPAKPPTVYRALEFLTRVGLAHRIESLNAFIACGLDERPHTAAFLVCDCCGTALEIEPPASGPVEAAAQAAGYRLNGVTVEAHGLCSDCADR
jgi:Fur family zinc uptake transcriptional regulator